MVKNTWAHVIFSGILCNGNLQGFGEDAVFAGTCIGLTDVLSHW